MIRGKNEPDGLGAEIFLWIDCSVCGQWAHNMCVWKLLLNTHQYVLKVNCLVFVIFSCLFGIFFSKLDL